MNPLQILKMGDPALRKISTAYTANEILSGPVQMFARSLYNLLKQTRGLGISAPQVGVLRRLVILDIPKNKARPDCDVFPPTFCFNPEIEVAPNSTKINMWESCLSVPDLVAKVERFNEITLKYLDHTATPRRAHCTGFIAGVIQHEVDHLNGKLFVDSVTDMSTLAFKTEWQKHANKTAGICLSGKVKFL